MSLKLLHKKEVIQQSEDVAFCLRGKGKRADSDTSLTGCVPVCVGVMTLRTNCFKEETGYKY